MDVGWSGPPEAATIPTKTIRAITRDPEIHSGAPVFTGTRIAVRVLFDYLEDEQTVDDFVSHYPSISRKQAIAALEEVEEMLRVSAWPELEKERRMPTLWEEAGFIFRFRMGDCEERPHVHVTGNGGAGKIWLRPVAL